MQKKLSGSRERKGSSVRIWHINREAEVDQYTGWTWMRKEQEETGRGAVWKRAAHREPGMVGWDQFAWKPG